MNAPHPTDNRPHVDLQWGRVVEVPTRPEMPLYPYEVTIAIFGEDRAEMEPDLREVAIRHATEAWDAYYELARQAFMDARPVTALILLDNAARCTGSYGLASAVDSWAGRHGDHPSALVDA